MIYRRPVHFILLTHCIRNVLKNKGIVTPSVLTYPLSLLITTDLHLNKLHAAFFNICFPPFHPGTGCDILSKHSRLDPIIQVPSPKVL